MAALNNIKLKIDFTNKCYVFASEVTTFINKEDWSDGISDLATIKTIIHPIGMCVSDNAQVLHEGPSPGKGLTAFASSGFKVLN